ncbi:MAG: trypsin-like serine protease [Pseudobdellovibrionaceae bacterium]
MKTSLLVIYLLALSITVQALTHSSPAVDEEFHFNVLISTDGRDPQDGSMIPAFCNASFVHPLVLVTAAHCLRDAHVLKSQTVDIQTGQYKFVTKPDGTVGRVGYVLNPKQRQSAKFIFTKNLTAKINSQGFQTQIGPQEDLALVRLSSPLTDSLPMMAVISQQELRGIAASLTTYAPTVLSINPWADLTNLDTKRSANLNRLNWNGSGYFRSTSSSRVQEGDSGAPFFVRIGSNWKLAGVVKGKATTPFNDWDVFTGLDQKICELATPIDDTEIQDLLCH